MAKARKNSTTVSLTQVELERLHTLYNSAWGSSYNPDRTQKKLDKALDRIKTQQQAARNRAAS